MPPPRAHNGQHRNKLVLCFRGVFKQKQVERSPRDAGKGDESDRRQHELRVRFWHDVRGACLFVGEQLLNKLHSYMSGCQGVGVNTWHS